MRGDKNQKNETGEQQKEATLEEEEVDSNNR